ncbi:MAG TPA: hypothetical protein VKB00_05405 [Candidatus Limnocylindrales bacterium]|jgi:hypothetical protein|nr:hypothetical protein [Candidatus Limnocylindrales bacterium]
MTALEADLQPHILDALEADEEIVVNARTVDAVVAVSDRRLIVADSRRVALSVPFERLRRIQLDIERDRPATLVVVPEEASDPPQVLVVSPDQYHATADALVRIGLRLAEQSRSGAS